MGDCHPTLEKRLSEADGRPTIPASHDTVIASEQNYLEAAHYVNKVKREFLLNSSLGVDNGV